LIQHNYFGQTHLQHQNSPALEAAATDDNTFKCKFLGVTRARTHTQTHTHTHTRARAHTHTYTSRHHSN
jgi:hypothetical protein